MTKRAPVLIGAHTSTAGGLYRSLLEGQEIGATVVQIFTRNQKRWENKPLDEEEILLYRKTIEETKISQVMSHAGYLINLGCPNKENLYKSRKAFAEEIRRCLALEIDYCNFHPGAALDGSEESCLETIIESLKETAPLTTGNTTRLLLETTAGQGSCVGYSFEQIGYLIKNLEHTVPIGVCIDTCHIFAAGYDIRTEEAIENTLAEFEEHIGLKHLFALHLNDSQKPLGSKVDRHANLGEGHIGMESFRRIMQHPRLYELPKYLETPGGPEIWKKEIALLKQFAQQ